MDAMQHIMMQKSIKDNAETLQSTVKDLYQWEKSMKVKEKQLKNSENESKTDINVPIRSHVEDYKQSAETSDKIDESLTNGKTESSLGEKQNSPEKELTAKEKAILLKEKGNGFVKAGDHQNAIKEYTNAILLYDKDPVFYTNRSLCYLKLARYGKCIDDCDKAISMDSKAVKAYFRRMQAYEQLELYQEAVEDCLHILKIEPKNILTKKSLQEIEKKLTGNETPRPTRPVFTKITDDMKLIQPFNKKAHLRSQKPLKTVQIEEVINTENGTSFVDNMKITDELLDEIFNSFDAHQPTFTEPKKQKLSKETCVYKEVENVSPVLKICNDKEITNAAEAKTVKEAKLSKTIKTKNETFVYKEVENSCPVTKKYNDKIEEITNTAEASTFKEATFTKTNESNKAIGNKVSEHILPSVSQNAHSTTSITAQHTKSPNNVKDLLKAGNQLIDPLKTPVSVKNDVLPDKPTTTIEFYSNWRDLCMEKKYLYLKSIEVEKITKILGAEFSSDILSDIVEIFSKYYIPNKCPVGRILLQICKHPEIGILSMLLSNNEKSEIFEIVRNIELNEKDFENIELIKNVFSI